MDAPRRSKIGAVLRVTCGNFLEMYDFMVFGYYAASIGRAFFPSQSEFASLMLTLLTFGAGFLMRPLGALLLGAYIDSIGRKKGLVLTLGLMSAGVLLLACVPGYDRIGSVAPVLVLIGRLLQGLSAGVELGGVSVYLSEIATRGNKGFYVSWQSASQQAAVVFTAVLGVLLTTCVSPEDMVAWGWRIPLFVGCLIVPFLFVIRGSLEETEAFARRKTHPSIGEVVRSIAMNLRLVTQGTMLVVMTTVSFYLVTAYTPTFGTQALHLAPRDSLLVTLCVGLTTFVLLPTVGALSDRVGRRPLLIAGTSLAMLTGYPSMLWLASAPSFGRLLAVDIWLAILYATYNGAMVVHLTEIMPSRVRTAGFSLAYSLATALFGGFTAAICTWLIELTGNAAMPGAWLSFAALISGVAVLLPYARAVGGPDE